MMVFCYQKLSLDMALGFFGLFALKVEPQLIWFALCFYVENLVSNVEHFELNVEHLVSVRNPNGQHRHGQLSRRHKVCQIFPSFAPFADLPESRCVL